MDAERSYTSRLGAGLGMISETLELLRLWEPGMIAPRLADLAIETGTFSRTTARRAVDITGEMFAPRYLVSDGAPAARLKYLLEHRLPVDALTQLFFLQTCRAHAILTDFIVGVYWPKYSAGATALTRSDAENFIHQALDAGRMQSRWGDKTIRWSETTIRRTAGYLLGCCLDFGLLAEGNRKERPIKRFSIRPDVALYLAHDLHFAGESDGGVVQHPDWSLFGLEAADVVRLLTSLSHDGHLLVQAGADLVQISWKYRTMEDCLRALTQR